MRIQELRLAACGPFTNYCLDLSGGNYGLHLIYGPNEAGKSSALRAIAYLLFGFPPQLADDFIHPYQTLRVGARISNNQGEELECVRRKAAKNSLRSKDDAGILSEEDLRRFCGNIDEDRFKGFFGIDHGVLVEGGRKIAAGSGDLGQILFSGSGVKDLKAVLEGLKQESEELFLPSGRSRRLHQLLTKLTDTRRAIREHQLPAKEWECHQRTLDEALERKRAAETEFQEKSRELHRFERIRKALPLIAALTDLQSEIAPLADVPRLSAKFRDRRQTVQEELRAAEREQSRASKNVDDYRKEFDALDVPQSLLRQRASIEQVSRNLNVYLQAENDRPGLESKAAQLEANARDTMRRLGRDLDIQAANALQVPEAKRLRIRNLSEQYGGISKELDNWGTKLDELDRELDDKQGELAGSPAARDVSPLATALQDALRLGDAEDQRLSAVRIGELLAQKTTNDLKKLPLWSGSLDQLEALALPLAETVDRFETEFVEVAQQLAGLRREANERQEEAHQLEETIAALRTEFDLPTDLQLQAARERRQQGWHLIRDAWLTGKEPSDAVKAFVSSVGGHHDLAGAFERSVATADEIVDRLRHEAGRVATHAQLVAQLEACLKRLALVRGEIESFATRSDTMTEDWNRHWALLNSEPLTPREMRAWNGKRAELIREAEELRRQRKQFKQLDGRISEQQGRLARAIFESGGSSVPDSTALSQLTSTAQQVLDTAVSDQRQRRELENELRRMEKERRATHDRLAAAQRKMETWQHSWNDAIAGLPADASGTPTEVNGILDLLSTLTQQLHDVNETRGRLEQIDSYASRFTADLGNLTTEIASDLDDLPVARAAIELSARLENAIVAEQKRGDLSRRVVAEEENIRSAATTIETMQSQLNALCVEARCQSSADLPDAEERSNRRHELTGQIESLEKQLRSLSAGQTLDGFVAETKSIDPDSIELSIQWLEEQIASLDHELKDVLGPAIGAERSVLNQMDSGSRAADAADEFQDLVAQVAVNVDEYARLRLALIVLRKGIERYRELHQGPICQRASKLFAHLTLNAFSGLREDYDSDGKPELVGVRTANGKTVRVGEMSDGTADQLYLAVRLAWLDEYLEHHEAIPFIIDDVLIRFDNERAIAALELLADLSRRTQVIFFTHHRHTVELARQAVDNATLFIQDLPADSLIESSESG